MKSITESIIGRRGAPKELHKFNDLKYGDFVTIEVPEVGINNIYLYIPNNILNLPDVKSDENGRFICPVYTSYRQSDVVIDGMEASKFVKNFPIRPESTKYYYGEITKYNGHTEEYKYIKDENDVVELFRKYRFL